MATNFPGALDSYTTKVDNVDDVLAAHINNVQDAIVALEVKMGADSSVIASAIDYFLKHASGAYRTHIHDGGSDDGANIPVANVTGAVATTGAQSIAGVKTFTSFPITPSLAPTTNYQVSNKKYVDDTIPDVMSDMILRGFELKYKGTSDLYVEPGTLFVGSTRVNTTVQTILTLATGSDWIDGSAPSLTSIFVYIYVDASGNIKLEETPPTKADTSGNTAGTLLYHLEGSTYWRCIGAVSTDGSGNIRKFFQSKDWIYYSDPIPVCDTLNTSWTDLPLGTCTDPPAPAASSGARAVPAISTFVALGASAYDYSTQYTNSLFIRPKGATGWEDIADRVHIQANTSKRTIGVQRMLVTDSSQTLQYKTVYTDIVSINVEGYRLNIR